MLSLGSDRAQQLSDNGTQVPRQPYLCLTPADGLLADIIERVPSSYTLLYLTSPREFPETDSVLYQPDEDAYQDPVHMEIKRDYAAHSSSSSSSPRSSDKSGRRKSLFDEYQYFTPGMYRFSALLVCPF